MSGKDKYILAIDHGTSGAKTSLVTTKGEVVDFEYASTPIKFLPGGGAEQDPEDWWKAIVKTTRKLLDKGSVPADDIAAVCCSSTFSSTVAVNREGKHLDNCLTWMDSRAAPYIKELAGGFPRVEGYGVFKALEWIRKTGGGPQLSGKDDIAHVLFWKYERPDVYNRAHMFLGSKDYLNLRLTGKFAASYDSMTLFWITDIRDINNPRYDDGLIARFGVDKSKLPPMRPSTDVLGEVSESAASELGLPRGVKVVMGSPDHQSACIGSGAVRDFEGHLYIGTSSWVQCIVPFKKTDMFHSIASIPTSIPGKYQAANEQDIAGGALGFFMNSFLFPQNELNPQAPPDDAYALFDKVAAGSPPGANRVIFAPWLNGERTPVDNTSVRAGFYNLSLSTTPADLARSVMEGVALNTRWALKYVERFIGRKMDPINIIGGGARSDLWCRIFSDVLGREIRQVADPMQANARGAAFIAGVALGHISFNDIPTLMRYKRTYKPDPDNKKVYDDLMREFLAIYKNNRAMYRRLNSSG